MRDAEAVRAPAGDARPDVVINAAAYNKVDAAETEPGEALAVNAAGAAAPGARGARGGRADRPRLDRLRLRRDASARPTRSRTRRTRSAPTASASWRGSCWSRPRRRDLPARADERGVRRGRQPRQGRLVRGADPGAGARGRAAARRRRPGLLADLRLRTWRAAIAGPGRGGGARARPRDQRAAPAPGTAWRRPRCGRRACTRPSRRSRPKELGAARARVPPIRCCPTRATGPWACRRCAPGETRSADLLAA